uniref:GPI-anchored protein LLG1-like domain-containing protein n=1 Tax=Ananas comosus var. bracteatus TaxID=296719 RepID=A0A6V7QXD8_ANACO
MGFHRMVFLRTVLLTLCIGLATSSFISDGVFHSHGSTGRSLLQAKKNCPENFEFLNYTIITSQCKGPQYPPSLCCSAFKQFACPYVDYLNDATNDCASTMFSYINLYGKYPPGLFASECREGKLGLACPPGTAQSDTANTSDSSTFRSIDSFIAVVFGVLLVLFS